MRGSLRPIENVILGIAARAVKLSPCKVLEVRSDHDILAPNVSCDRSRDMYEAGKLADVGEVVSLVASGQNNLCHIEAKAKWMSRDGWLHLGDDAFLAGIKMLDYNEVADANLLKNVAVQGR